MEQHINYITLGVGDLAMSRRSYQDVFGWKETADSNENIAFFQAGKALRFALFSKEALAEDAQMPKWTRCLPRLPQKMCISSKPRRKCFGVDTTAISPTPTAFYGKLPLIRFCRNCAETAH